MTEINIDRQFRKNVLLNIVIKGGAILLSLVSVNIYLDNLGNAKYGLWVTISSIASWVSRGDLGIGNGLRNEIAKAYAEKDKEKQERLIGASLKTFVKLSAALFLIITAASEVMIGTNVLEAEARLPLYITNVFTCFNFVLGVFWSVANAYQMDYLTAGMGLFGSALNAVIILASSAAGISSNLVFFAVISGLTTTFSSILVIISLKRKIGLRFRIAEKHDHDILHSVRNVGLQFFVLQLCSLILYSTDNVIINRLFGGEEVTRYSIITKVYNTGEMLFSILLVSLWSAVTYQYSLKNYRWITDKIRQMLSIWAVFSIGVIAVSAGFNLIVKIWLQERAMPFNADIIIVFAVYTIAGMFGSIFVNVSNGIGVIKLQMIMSVVEAVLNVPLSVFLATTCGMGIAGVKAATLICCTGANIVMPVYVLLLLRRKMKEQEQVDI